MPKKGLKNTYTDKSIFEIFPKYLKQQNPKISVVALEDMPLNTKLAFSKTVLNFPFYLYIVYI